MAVHLSGRQRDFLTDTFPRPPGDGWTLRISTRVSMSQLKWLIESSVFGISSEPIKAAIRSQGMAFEVVHARPFLNGVVPEVAGRKLTNDDCVVFWGSPPLMHHIRKHYAWRPGGWCNFSTLNCAEYYPRLQHWLLNNNCHIGTIDDLQRDTNSLFAQFSNDSKVFVRPCTVEKVFTGQLVTKDDFAGTLDRARYANCLVLVARPVPISCEWRLIVCRGTAIASSQYRRWGNLDVRPGCPDQVARFTSEVWLASQWTPDDIFVVDVCESNGDLHVLELNSFSCSGWYECDPAVIVACATKLACESWMHDDDA